MNERKWDFEELIKLCRQKGIPDSTIYQKSLLWRRGQADFHAEKAQETWTKLFRQRTINEGKIEKAVFQYEAYAHACVQCLHSQADILAHIINVVILATRFPEHDVKAWPITQCMEKSGKAPQVAQRMRALLNSNEFCYLKALCNTIKHRIVVNADFRIKMINGHFKETSIGFVQFKYRGVTYPETSGRDILEKYRKQIRQLVIDVGLSISKFVAGI